MPRKWIIAVRLTHFYSKGDHNSWRVRSRYPLKISFSRIILYRLSFCSHDSSNLWSFGWNWTQKWWDLSCNALFIQSVTLFAHRSEVPSKTKKNLWYFELIFTFIIFQICWGRIDFLWEGKLRIQTNCNPLKTIYLKLYLSHSGRVGQIHILLVGKHAMLLLWVTHVWAE